MKTKLLGCWVAAVALSSLWCPQTATADPIRWEVRFPYQNSPPPEDRYGINPFGNSPMAPAAPSQPSAYPGGVAPPPGVVIGGQSAVTDPASALRQGIESGMQQANQQFSATGNRVMESAQSVGNGFSTQAQDFSNSAQRQFNMTSNDFRNSAEQTYGMAADGFRQVGDSFGVTAPGQPVGISSTAAGTRAAIPSGYAPPPPQNSQPTTAPLWSSAPAPPLGAPPAGSAPPPRTAQVSGNGFDPGAPGQRPVAPAASSPNWSSFGNNAPLPPLVAPSLAPPANRSAPSATVTGPVIPPATPSNSGGFYSELVDPQSRSSAMPPANATTGGSVFDRSPIFDSPTAGNNRTTSAGSSPVATDSRLNLPAPPSSGTPGFSFGTPGQTTLPPPSAPLGNNPPPTATNIAGGQVGANRPISAANTAAVISGQNPAPPAAITNAPPWLPLVFVSLALIGSVSANVFLGWSYVDARQKYQTLVRKTAGKFRRAAEAA